jgi:hypothetical protein
MKTYLFIQSTNGYIDCWVKPSLNLLKNIEIYGLLKASRSKDYFKIKKGFGEPSVYTVQIPDYMGEITVAKIEKSQELRQFIMSHRIEKTHIDNGAVLKIAQKKQMKTQTQIRSSYLPHSDNYG